MQNIYVIIYVKHSSAKQTVCQMWRAKIQFNLLINRLFLALRLTTFSVTYEINKVKLTGQFGSFDWIGTFSIFSPLYSDMVRPLTYCRPRWLNWMCCLTGDQEVAGSAPAEVGNILAWRLSMKYFLRSFSPFRLFKKGICQFLAKECAQYWLTT